MQEARGVAGVGIVFAVQLKDEGATRAYSRTAREKVATDDGLEHGALTAALAAHDDDLGKGLPHRREVLAVRGVDVVAGQGARFLRRGSFSRERLDIFHAVPASGARATPTARSSHLQLVHQPEQGLERARRARVVNGEEVGRHALRAPSVCRRRLRERANHESSCTHMFVTTFLVSRTLAGRTLCSSGSAREGEARDYVVKYNISYFQYLSSTREPSRPAPLRRGVTAAAPPRRGCR